MVNKPMRDLYLNALKKLKNPSESSYKMFALDWSYQEITQPVRAKIAPQKPKIAGPKKQEVLESFAEFSKEKLEVVEKLSFRGGEVLQKNQEFSFELPTNLDPRDLLVEYKLFSENFIKTHLEDKLTGAIKVLFVSDIYLNQSFENLTSTNQFHCCFDENVSALFAKMVGAMGLNSDQILVSALSDEAEELDLSKSLLAEIRLYRPEYIVSLGAQATAFFIGPDRKLRNHHGQLFQLNFAEDNDIIFSASLMPLFSPKLLSIAPNMKKTAWTDMQKLMQKF